MVRYRICMDALLKGLVHLSEPLATKFQHPAIANHSSSHTHGSVIATISSLGWAIYEPN